MKTHILKLTIILLYATAAWSAERDAVVKIESKTGKCSGVCVDAAGYILTAEHCISRMQDGVWVLFGDKRFKATIVFDPERNQTDQAALLKVESPYPLPYVRIAEKTPQKGDKVHTKGFPIGKYAEASGEITSVSMSLRTLQQWGEQTAYRIFVNFSTASGNSGGPLFNKQGEVVGLGSTGGIGGAGWIGLQSIENAMKHVRRVSISDQRKNKKPIFWAFSPDY